MKYLIKKETEDAEYYFKEWMFGIPSYGMIEDASVFDTKWEAEKYLSLLRKNVGAFGSRYNKGISIIATQD